MDTMALTGDGAGADHHTNGNVYTGTDVSLETDNGDSGDDLTETDNFISEVDTICLESEVKPRTVSLKCINIRPDLLKFKIFYFSFGGAIGAFFPYWSVYLKQMGLSPKQIGVLSGIKPLIGLWTGPLWGSLADRFRKRKLILTIGAVAWLVSISSIGLIPAPNYDSDQCDYVRDFLNISKPAFNQTYNSTSSPPYITSRDEFDQLHGEIPGVSQMENILESRGWMYERKDLNRVYYSFLTLTLAGEFLMSPLGALGDSMCLEHIANNQDGYGHQRAFGSLGIGVLSLFVGSLVSTTRHDVNRCDVTVTVSNYSSIYYVFAICMVVCTGSTLLYKSSSDGKCGTNKSKPNPFKVYRMFLTAHYASWLFCMLFTGVCNGVIWGFLFWHLENIGATQFLLGLANGISLFAEMVMFLVVFKLLNYVGSLTFMAVGLVGYTIRFAVFATMKNPWLVLPFEILQGATFAGVWSAFVKYMCSSVPAEYSGTLQGFLHSMYWGVGSGSGHFLGGALIERFGARSTFWIFSALSFSNMVIFVIVQKCSTKPDVFSDYNKSCEDDTIELVTPSTEDAEETTSPAEPSQ